MFKFILIKTVLLIIICSIIKSGLGYRSSQRDGWSSYRGRGRPADVKGEWADGPQCYQDDHAMMMYKVKTPWMWFSDHQALWFRTTNNCNYTVELIYRGANRRSGMFAKVNE